MKKRLLAALVILTLTLAIIPSCSSRGLYSEGNGELNIVCTNFPPFEFARIIGGEKVTVTILQDDGADLHNYTPTSATLTALNTAHIFICVGGESDEWVDNAVTAANNPALIVIRLMDLIEQPKFGAIQKIYDEEDEHEHNHEDGENDEWPNAEIEEHFRFSLPQFPEFQSITIEHLENGGLNLIMSGITDDAAAIEDFDVLMINEGWVADTSNNQHLGKYTKEGADKTVSYHSNFSHGVETVEITISGTSSDDGHNHDHDDEDHDHEHHEDEHVWNSLKNAKAIVKKLAEKISEADSLNSAYYSANAADYIHKLDTLDKKYEEAVSSAAHKTLVFADRFPFVYMMEDYKISYYAAFSGCSTDVNASFETQTKLLQVTKDLGLPAVITLEGTNATLAKTISEQTGCKVLAINSMQSVKRANIKEGITYLKIMENNLEVLKEAMN